jgi:hypothetical protein
VEDAGVQRAERKDPLFEAFRADIERAAARRNEAVAAQEPSRTAKRFNADEASRGANGKAAKPTEQISATVWTLSTQQAIRELGVKI